MNLNLGTESPVSYTDSPISYSGQTALDGPLNPPHLPLHQPTRTSMPVKYNATQGPQYKSQTISHTSMPPNYIHAPVAQFLQQPSHYTSQAPQFPAQGQSQYISQPVQYYNQAPNNHLPQTLSRHDSVQPSLNNHAGQVDYLNYNIPNSSITHTAVSASANIAPSVARDHQFQVSNDYEDEYVDPWSAFPAPVSAPPPPKRRQTVPVGSVANYGDMLHLGGGMESYGFSQPLQYSLHTPS